MKEKKGKIFFTLYRFFLLNKSMDEKNNFVEKFHVDTRIISLPSMTYLQMYFMDLTELQNTRRLYVL